MKIIPLEDITLLSSNIQPDTTPLWNISSGYSVDVTRRYGDKLYTSVTEVFPLVDYIYNNTDPLNPHKVTDPITGEDAAGVNSNNIALINTIDSTTTSPAVKLLHDPNNIYAYYITKVNIFTIDTLNYYTASIINNFTDYSFIYDAEISNDGDTLFIFEGNFLKIIDVSNPSSPTEVTTLNLGDSTFRDYGNSILSSDGNTLYYCGYTLGLVIIDVTDVSNPSVLDTYDTLGGGSTSATMAINSTETRAYISLPFPDNLLVLDISVKTNITLLQTLTTGGYGLDLEISNNDNYLFSKSTTILNVWDITSADSGTATVVDSISFTSSPNTGDRLIKKSNDGTYLDVLFNNNDIKRIDITTPTSIAEITTYNDLGTNDISSPLVTYDSSSQFLLATVIDGSTGLIKIYKQNILYYPCVQATTTVYVQDNGKYFRYKNIADANIDFSVEDWLNIPANFDDLGTSASLRITQEIPDNSLLWFDEGVVNELKMFDSSLSTQTVNTGNIIVEIDAYKIDSVSILNMDGVTSIRIMVTETSSSSVIFDETISTQTRLVSGWKDYFFAPFRQAKNLIQEVPITFGATIKVYINGTTPKVGLLAIGKSEFLGGTRYGMRISSNDFSKKEADEDGNFFIQSGKYQRTVDMQVEIANGSVDNFVERLDELRATPVIYSGADDFNTSKVFGFYKDYDTLINTPTQSILNIEVESLT